GQGYFPEPTCTYIRSLSLIRCTIGLAFFLSRNRYLGTRKHPKELPHISLGCTTQGRFPPFREQFLCKILFCPSKSSADSPKPTCGCWHACRKWLCPQSEKLCC